MAEEREIKFVHSKGLLSATAATDILSPAAHAQGKSGYEGQSRKASLAVSFTGTLSEDAHATFAANLTDFKEALIAAIAQRCHADYIVTRSIKDYQDSPVKLLTPKKHLVMLIG